MGDIRTFTDLDVWEKGHTLVISVYMATKEFPPEERYSLSDQMRRSAVSTTSNIADDTHRLLNGLLRKTKSILTSNSNI